MSSPVTASYYTALVLIAILAFLLGTAAAAAGMRLLWVSDRERRGADTARLQSERDAALREAAAERARSAESQAQVRDAFASLSRSALKENRDDFLHDASGLLTPLRQTLDRVQQHLTDVDKLREGSFRAVTTELGALRRDQEQLRSAAEGLSRSLSSPNIRGAWGEIQLRRVVELSGMLEHCDFEEKATTTDAGARQTPDLIIKLPGDARIVVDSKVPIHAFRAGLATTDAVRRQEALDAHARQVREHIKALGAKAYWKTFQPGPDYVVMFVPLEALMTAAFEHDETLFDLAVSEHVVLATPMTLLALLKAAAAGWSQQRLAENAERIQDIGRELFERLVTMSRHIEDVGDGLQRAANSYNSFVGSLEQKVLPGARRFKELGVASTKDLPDLEPLRLELRPLVKPELTARGEDDVIVPLRAIRRD